MSNLQRIRVLRGACDRLLGYTEIIGDGQPVFNDTFNYLSIGNTSNSRYNQLEPITTNRIEGNLRTNADVIVNDRDGENYFFIGTDNSGNLLFDTYSRDGIYGAIVFKKERASSEAALTLLDASNNTDIPGILKVSTIATRNNEARIGLANGGELKLFSDSAKPIENISGKTIYIGSIDKTGGVDINGLMKSDSANVGALTVTGTTSLQGATCTTLTASGKTTLNNNVEVTLSSGKTLVVKNSSGVELFKVDANGNVHIKGKLTVDGDAEVLTNLNVTGNTSNTGNITVNGDLKINSN